MTPARLLVLGWLLLALSGPAAAERPRVAFIIDDLGNHRELGLKAQALPGPVACAVMPHTPYGPLLARACHRQGKPVLLHLPMESVGERPLGPGGLYLHMTRFEFLRTLREGLVTVPYAEGVNNHMGSLLTRHPGFMGWLLRALHAYGLYFVDSRTTAATVGMRIAAEQGVPARERDVFLDNVPERAAIAAQFERLLARARARGSAVAIGHPYPETLAFLQRALPRLEARGFRLVPLSARLSDARIAEVPISALLKPGPALNLAAGPAP